MGVVLLPLWVVLMASVSAMSVYVLVVMDGGRVCANT